MKSMSSRESRIKSRTRNDFLQDKLAVFIIKWINRKNGENNKILVRIYVCIGITWLIPDHNFAKNFVYFLTLNHRSHLKQKSWLRSGQKSLLRFEAQIFAQIEQKSWLTYQAEIFTQNGTTNRSSHFKLKSLLKWNHKLWLTFQAAIVAQMRPQIIVQIPSSGCYSNGTTNRASHSSDCFQSSSLRKQKEMLHKWV